MSSNTKVLYSLKKLFHNTRTGIGKTTAKAFRALPGVPKWLGIPSYRIRNFKHWAEKHRKGNEYISLYPAMKTHPVAAKCPTCKKSPAAPVKTAGNKHYDYWDPKSGYDSKNGFFQKPFEEHAETFLAHIPRGKILGPGGAVIVADGGLVDESLWTWNDWISNDRSQKSLKLPAAKKVTGTYYTVVSNYAEGYPHWLMEVLPRLYGLEHLPFKTKPTIIFNRELNGWQKETIRLMGFSDYPSIALNDSFLRPDELYMPSYVGIPGTPHPEGCKWVKERIMKNVQQGGSPARIYISRKLAKKRKVLNEDEVVATLSKYGFIEVAAEELPFAEQVALFARAESIVSSHGAGLGNLLFAPRGCKVLEILDRDYVNDHYYSLSGIMDLDYYYQLTSSVNADKGKSLTKGHDHIYIDIPTLENSLKAMFS